MKYQLYRSYKNISFADRVIFPPNSRRPLVKFKELECLTLLMWPNGKPCTLANMWLHEVANSSTGKETTITYASQLTHTIRYCFRLGIEFSQLTDWHIKDLVNFLTNELKPQSEEKKRGTNQIYHIMHRLLEFLIWYQDNYRLSSQQLIIGTLGSGSQITIKKAYNSKSKKYFMTHEDIPSLGPGKEDKHPMPDTFISDIEDAIVDKSLINMPPTSDDSDNLKFKMQKIISNYLYERRMFLLWLMKRTGLRPQELHDIPIMENLHISDTRRLLIPTAKTRAFIAPIREFPITLEDSIDFNRYIKIRESYIDFLISINTLTRRPSFLFLGINGQNITKQSLTRDFKRITEAAGLTDVKVCLSMFRHRFITKTIAYEIRKELIAGLEEKDLWEEAVKLKICKKTIKLTGHKDPKSLKTYFDEALALEISKYHPSDTINTESSIERQLEIVTSLRHLAKRFNDNESLVQIQDIQQKLLKLKE